MNIYKKINVPRWNKRMSKSVATSITHSEAKRLWGVAVMSRVTVIAVTTLLSVLSFLPLNAQPTLINQFKTPNEEAKPWCFWYWMYGAVSKEGITADLEAMKEIGLGGTYLMPIRSPERGPEFSNPMMQLTPEWYEMVSHSMQEADRLGLKLGMHICDGFALAGGPWITPEESMQKITWSDTIVSGGKIKNMLLKQPESYKDFYKDVALFALPANKQKLQIPIITSDNPDDPMPFSGSKDAFRSNQPCWIQYEYTEPFTCRNIEIVLSGRNHQAQRLKVMASDDGINFRMIKQLIPARQGWQNQGINSTHAIPATTAKYFRFYWDPAGSEPGNEDMDDAKWRPNLKIKNLILSNQPRINQWEGKAGYVWRVANLTTNNEVPVSDCIRKEDIIDLTSYLKDGILTAELPEGNWRLLRMGHTSTGLTNDTGGAGKGLECDKFNAQAVKKQFDNWFAAMFRNTTPGLANRVLKYMHIDSWECGSQNWSTTFPTEFKQRRGYDLIPYLPLLIGIPIESVEVSEKVLHDVRTTISELVVDVFFKVFAEQAKAYDCELSAECVSPTMVSDGMLHYQAVDRPMGEFWLRSPTHDKPNDMLDAISGAHIYGKRLVQAEGFTQIRGVWDEHPGMLKTLLDRNFALGINKMFYHVYAHNPWLDRKPGMTLDGIGLFFQRDQTWWKQGKAFVDYTTRCQALLQYGVSVTDIAVFTGEEMPRRAILPERLVPTLPGIFGADRVEEERIRLANEGQPIRELPVGVFHSANMADPENWINPMRGYAYDSFNRDALLRLAEVKDGRMILPGGASYKVFVLPLSRPMNPDNLPLSTEVQTKIEELRRGGVIIPEIPYQASDFSAYGLEHDIIVPEGIAWTHRRGEEADIYFIANQKDEKISFDASMRISGRQVQLWNPVTGEIKVVKGKSDGKRTIVSVSLEANESLFVVFPVDPVWSKMMTVESKRQPERMPLQIKGWNVTFPAINSTLSRNELFDWSKESDEQIKYYSGTAIYKTSFKWKGKPKGRIYLSLGEIANIATIRLNGIDCGTVWTAPYHIELTEVLRKGTNELEIEVANTWANAIRGADNGKAPFKGIWTDARYRMPGDELLPAGLLGPCELVIIHP